jgi:glutaredoxin
MIERSETESYEGVPEVVLYVRTFCEPCEKVKSFISTLSPERRKKIAIRDATTNQAYREEVLQYGGMAQLPFLIKKNWHGAPIYESEDIIAYLKKRYA